MTILPLWRFSALKSPTRVSDIRCYYDTCVMCLWCVDISFMICAIYWHSWNRNISPFKGVIVCCGSVFHLIRFRAKYGRIMRKNMRLSRCYVCALCVGYGCALCGVFLCLCTVQTKRHRNGGLCVLFLCLILRALCGVNFVQILIVNVLISGVLKCNHFPIIIWCHTI